MALFLCALTAALVVTGCGGGGGDESVQISKREFVQRGSAICVATRREIRSDFEVYVKSKEGREDELAEKAGELTPEEAAAKVGATIIVPAMRRELEEFRALGIPEGDDGRVKALFDAFDEGVEQAAMYPERAASNGTEAFGESGRLAGEYGLDGC